MLSYADFSNPATYSMGTELDMAPIQSTAVKQNAVASTSTGVVPPTVAGAPVATPMAAATGNGNPGFFQAGGGASLALGAIQTLGSLWNSFQQNKLAKQSLALQTRAFETNLRNQTQTYNTALEDRINARYATEGRSGEAAAYIERNKL